MEQSLKQVLGDEVHFKAEHVALQLLCCVFLQHLLPFVELVWLERLSLPLAEVQRQNQQEINLAPGAIPALPHQKTKIKAFTCSSRSSLVQNALRPT